MPAQQAQWMPSTDSDFELLKGMKVISRDGEDLGKIADVVHPDHAFRPGDGGHFFLFHPGKLKAWFGGLDDAYLPESTIIGVMNGEVMIELTEDQIKRRRWDMPSETGYVRS